MINRFVSEFEKNIDGKHHANRILAGMDFSKRNLANGDFRGAKLMECNFDYADCTGTNFTDANCYGATFRGTKLYKANFTRTNLATAIMDGADMRGVTVTLQCDTFDNLQISSKWWKCWLFFALMMEGGSLEEKAKLEEIIGTGMVARLREARLSI